MISSVMPFDPSGLPALRSHLSLCLRLLEQVRPLLDAFVVDFFTEDHWDTLLPEGWKHSLEFMTEEELAQWMQPEQKGMELRQPLPLAMLALRQSLRSLCLPRTPCGGFHEIAPHFDLSDNGDPWPSFERLFSTNGLEHSSLFHVFRKHVKPKKQHEIARMSELASKLLRGKSSSRRLVDVGSGVGHLSRLLAHGRGFSVVCADAEADFTASASKFDGDLRRAAASGRFGEGAKDIGDPPRHLTYIIRPDAKAEDLEEKLRKTFGDDESKDDFEYGLIGLHSCGDLGPSILRLFASPSSKATTVLSAGCCYMRMEKLFPLSQYWKEQGEDSHLSYVARELSCHAIEVYCQRLKDGQSDRLRVHCYRAILEKLIQSRDPRLKHAGLRSVPHPETMTFAEYTRRATSRMKMYSDSGDKEEVSLEWSDEELDCDLVKRLLPLWRRVVCLYSLRLSLAPLAETAMLLDRCIFLAESGAEGVLAAVFDPERSPRNHVIIARKKG